MSDRLPYLATQAAAPYDELRHIPVSVLLDNVRSMYNVGSFFRTMDAAGCERLYLAGITARPPKNAISKTALGAEETFPWTHATDPAASIEDLRSRGYEIAAIETSVHAVDLFDWQPRFPVCLLFGHEVDGLPARSAGPLRHACAHPDAGAEALAQCRHRGRRGIYELLRKYRRMVENARVR